jgi:TDG/mug DNA glycosylase family protein
MLTDCLKPNLKIVFCGTAAGTKSAEIKQYYAGPGNKFWKTLYDVGLTPRQLAPSEYTLLTSFGIGLTDLVKGQAGMDKNIDFGNTDYDEFTQKILAFQPGILCFNGKKSAKECLSRKSPHFGFQPESIGITRLFVAPSTSGAANGYWDQSIWQSLAHANTTKNKVEIVL